MTEHGPIYEGQSAKVDLRRIPAPVHALEDGGPYFDAGVVIARDPETGVRNASIQRFMVVDEQTMHVNIDAGRHLELYLEKARSRGETLAFSLNCGQTILSGVEVWNSVGLLGEANVLGMYARRAAALADDAWDEAVRLAHPGAFEGDILAAMQGAVFRGGGDYAGNEFIIGSGSGALLCRYFSGRRHLDPVDQLTLEFAGAYRRYHAAMMRTLLTGRAHPEHGSMHAACVDALHACMEAIRPGRPMGEVFAAHAKVLDAAGLCAHRLNACGYGMGAVYNPLWVDPPMFYEGNPLQMQAGNVFFLHMIVMNSDTGRAMTLGHSVLVTEGGCECLSQSSLDLVVN